MSVTRYEDGARRPRAHDRGEVAVTLVEVLVVLVLALVLMTLAVSTMTGSKTTSKGREAEIAARAYGGAVVDFAIDNGGVLPQVGTADWPAVDAQRGPVNAWASRVGQRYLKATPEPVFDGDVRFVSGSTAPDTRATVTYERISLTQFRVTAWVDQARVCEVANVAVTAKVRAC